MYADGLVLRVLFHDHGASYEGLASWWGLDVWVGDPWDCAYVDWRVETARRHLAAGSWDRRVVDGWTVCLDQGLPVALWPSSPDRFPRLSGSASMPFESFESEAARVLRRCCAYAGPESFGDPLAPSRRERVAGLMCVSGIEYEPFRHFPLCDAQSGSRGWDWTSRLQTPDGKVLSGELQTGSDTVFLVGSFMDRWERVLVDGWASLPGCHDTRLNEHIRLLMVREGPSLDLSFVKFV
ncbi:hypothetical protein, partial [Bifidobacterium lemurum]